MNTEQEQQTITKPEPTKPKNPKRVAQGKRLAEISKEAKARKRATNQQELQHEESVLQLPGVSTSITIISAVAGVIGTYIAWQRFKHDTKNDNTNNTQPKTPTSPEPKANPLPTKIKYKNLDDDDI